MRRPGKIENVKKIHARAEKVLQHGGRQFCVGQWQWTRKGWEQHQEIQQGKRVSRGRSETPQGTWLGEARKGSLWWREVIVGSQVSGEDRADFLGEEQLGEEDDPATERRRVYTDLGLDLCKRKEQVVCHASALAMTDEARREAEM